MGQIARNNYQEKEPNKSKRKTKRRSVFHGRYEVTHVHLHEQFFTHLNQFARVLACGCAIACVFKQAQRLPLMCYR